MTRRLALAAAATLLALTGCTSKTPSATPTLDTVLTPTAAPTGAATATATNSPTSTPKSSPATTAPPTGPTILYFRVKTKPSCPSSGPGGTFGGNDAVLEWEAVNVNQVFVSIDGPGLFGTYDKKSSQSFPFACSSSAGTYKHKYILHTVGGGAEKTQTIELEAKVN
ncbi:hypothetical protein [Rhizocola hellebori]|nr:hypothetical protein [Rhizocola hellebori]